MKFSCFNNINQLFSSKNSRLLDNMGVRREKILGLPVTISKRPLCKATEIIGKSDKVDRFFKIDIVRSSKTIGKSRVFAGFAGSDIRVDVMVMDCKPYKIEANGMRFRV